MIRIVKVFLATIGHNLMNVTLSSINLGGRKVVVAIFSVAVALLCEAVFTQGLSENMLLLLLGVTGTFTAGNVAEHLSNRRKAIMPATSAASLTDTSLASLQSQVASVTEALNTQAQALNFLVKYAQSSQKIITSLST
jgi:hypothetical protein